MGADEMRLTINLCPGPVYSWVTKASKMNIAVRITARTEAKSKITGRLASILRSFFHHERGVYCALRFSTRNEPFVPHRTDNILCLIRHHSTNVTDQRRRIEEYNVE